ncbi:branched-chain amino acid ABC transporter permease [Haloarcula sp. S1AR25-5A]|uniref:Branched-chain amino acid ABC transporter permease n=1 Tax=Haloarcula terrestris TaxID=2950533 RepID=A0AAE4EZP0_9EURY|nr:branched-chain amino acid ABC transporter permease [Haloarcula terrestris]MDS0222389.1 branched-chain amino acid ABC transporter permease [Haloarcula terrestris]
MAPSVGLLNAILTGLVTGSIIALGAIGLALVYDIAEVPNFAHGDLLTLGAYAALLVNKPQSVPLFDVFATGPRAVGPTGIGLVFAISAVGVLGSVYHLGGVDAIRGGWWGIDVSPTVGTTTHVGLAVVVGALVVAGLPSYPAALLFSVVVLGALVPLTESVVFRKFREKDVELAMMLIVSLAMAFIIRFSIQTVFGGDIRFYEVDTTIQAAGSSVNFTFAKFIDLLVSANGVVINVLETRGTGTPQLFTLGYGWLEVIGILGVAALVAGGAYRRRRDTAGVVGPRLAAGLGGVAVLILGGALFAGGGTVPSATLYETRLRTSPLRLGIILTAMGLMGFLHYLLQATTLGKAMRATSDNRELAMIRGINTRRVMMVVWILAGMFAAVAGVLLGFLFSNITINLGFFLLLPMFAGVILGGISVYGAILGSYVVGLAMEVGIFAIPGLSATYRVPVAFVVLLLVLLIKPEGIVGD